MNLNVARAFSLDPQMTISSDLLGPLEVGNDELIRFPLGLLGFPECRSFVLVLTEQSGLYWLQSTEHSTLTFLLLDPFLFFEGYTVDISDADLREMEVNGPDEVSVLAIVTLPDSRSTRPTANLQGPLAINTRTRAAKQIVLEEVDHGTRSEFSLAEAPGA